MRCDEARAWISEYIDGVLPAGAAHDLDRHIDSCPDCATEYESIRRAVELVRRCEVVAPPEEFRKAWRDRLAETACQACAAGDEVAQDDGTGAGTMLGTQTPDMGRAASGGVGSETAALRAAGGRGSPVHGRSGTAGRGLLRSPGLWGALTAIKSLASRRISVSVGGLAAAALVAVLVLGTLQVPGWLGTTRPGDLSTKVAPAFEGATGRSAESGRLDYGMMGDMSADMAPGRTAASVTGGLPPAETKAMPGAAATDLAADTAGDATVAMMDAAAVQEEAALKTSVGQPAARKVILDASLRLRVKSYRDAEARLEEISRRAGGYVESSLSEATAGELRSGTVSLRIPQDAFDAVMAEIEGLGKVVYKDVSARDVTEQYIDLGRRLENARRQEAKLLELLKRASSVEDALAVERELGRVREQVELLTGKLNFLEHSVALSSIRVRLEEPSVASPWPPGLGLGDVLRRAAQAFVDTVGTLIVAAGRLLPVALLIVGSMFLYRRFKRGRAS